MRLIKFTKLRRGLVETRKGFVTELLDKLGDDPLTPESLDDLETILIELMWVLIQLMC